MAPEDARGLGVAFANPDHDLEANRAAFTETINRPGVQHRGRGWARARTELEGAELQPEQNGYKGADSMAPRAAVAGGSGPGSQNQQGLNWLERRPWADRNRGPRRPGAASSAETNRLVV